MAGDAPPERRSSSSPMVRRVTGEAPRPSLAPAPRKRAKPPRPSAGQSLMAYAVGGIIAVAGVLLLLVLTARTTPVYLPAPSRPPPPPTGGAAPRPALDPSEVLPAQLVAEAQRARAPLGQRTVLRRGPSPAPAPELLPSFGELVWPAGTRIITSDFGRRLDPVLRQDLRTHRGLDVRAECGTPVLAALSGRVTSVARSVTSGNVVKLDHPRARRSRYAHLSQVEVREGEWVAAGQRIGLSGATGRVTGPHLHFELWEDGRPLDPRGLLYRFLPADFFERVYVSPLTCGTLEAPASRGSFVAMGADEEVEPLGALPFSSSPQSPVDAVTRLAGDLGP